MQDLEDILKITSFEYEKFTSYEIKKISKAYFDTLEVVKPKHANHVFLITQNSFKVFWFGCF